MRIHLKNVHKVEPEPETEAGVKVTIAGSKDGKTIKNAIDSEALLYEYLKHSS